MSHLAAVTRVQDYEYLTRLFKNLIIDIYKALGASLTDNYYAFIKISSKPTSRSTRLMVNMRSYVQIVAFWSSLAVAQSLPGKNGVITPLAFVCIELLPKVMCVNKYAIGHALSFFPRGPGSQPERSNTLGICEPTVYTSKGWDFSSWHGILGPRLVAMTRHTCSRFRDELDHTSATSSTRLKIYL